jgi:hypothetical protein
MISPFIKLIQVSRNWRKQFNNAQQRAQQQHNSTRHNQRNYPEQKKKINPNVGEYVEFTETPVDSQSQPQQEKKSTKSTVTESQITDVTWEDINP